MYAADGSVMAVLKAEENRKPVAPRARCPQPVIDTVLAVEDAEFYDHRGVNARSLIRALLANVSAGGVDPRRLHDHAAGREERAAHSEARCEPEGQGGDLRGSPRAHDDEGRDPRALSEHRVLRQRRLRGAGRGRAVLRHRRRQPRLPAGGVPRRAHPQPRRLRPVPLPRPRDRPTPRSRSTA